LEKNGELVAVLDGRLDTAASIETEQVLSPLFDCTGHNIVFDCTKLEYISSSGLRLFLAVLKNAKPKGSHVYIEGINDDLRTIFAMTGFINLFEFR